VRRVDYFNNLTNLALHQHLADTQHTMGDFDLRLLPLNEHIKFNVGYSMDRSNGEGLTTNDYQRDEFAIPSFLKREGNDFRVGADARLGPVDISFEQGMRFFKDDTTYVSNGLKRR
jgi:hypothetical protein